MLHLFTPYPAPPPETLPVLGSFTYQPTSYLSIIDGVAGFANGTGAGFRPATGGAPNWYFITSTGSSTTLPEAVATRTYECTLPAAWEHDVSNKVIVNLTSGLFDLTSLTELNLRGDNVSCIGFTCRYGTGYGAALKLRSPVIIRGNNVYFSGWRIFVDPSGAIPPYFPGDQRDGVQAGWTPKTNNVVVDRCEVYGSIDEAFDTSNVGGNVTLVRSAVCKPNRNSGIHDVGHNYGISTGYGPGSKFTGQRVAIFHAAGRFPLGLTEIGFLSHFLIYNISDGAGNNSQCIQLDRHTSDSSSAAAHKWTVAHCLVLNGPQGYANNWVITSQNQQAGTQIYAEGMRARGFAQVSNADPVSFFGIEPTHEARPLRVTSIPSGTTPDGVGASLQYLDPIDDDLDFISMMRSEVGQHPKFPGDSQLSDLFTEAENYVNGTGSGYGSVGTTPTFPTLTTFTIDRTNPTHVSNYHGGVTIPDYTTRETIGANGRTLGEDALRQIGALSIGP